MITNKNGAPGQESAAEKQHSDSTSYVLRPPAGLQCTVCLADIADAALESGKATLLTVVHAREISIAVGVCQECTARAEREDGSTDALFSDIRATYRQDLDRAPHSQATEPRLGPQQLTMARRPVRTSGRRHPPFGARLAAAPPPPDSMLHIVLSWDLAEAVPEPKIVVRPEDNPARLRFDAAENRMVRLVHPADADPARLQGIAQALIDYGANQVELVIHPPRPGATGTESLRIVPGVTA